MSNRSFGGRPTAWPLAGGYRSPHWWVSNKTAAGPVCIRWRGRDLNLCPGASRATR